MFTVRLQEIWPPNNLVVGILIYMLVWSPCTISQPYGKPSLEEINPRRKKEGKILTSALRSDHKTLLIVTTTFCLKRRGQCMTFAQTQLR